MRVHKLIPVLALLLFAVPALAQEWAGRGRIQGVIKDDKGNPVEGATIYLRKGDTMDKNAPGPKPLTTDKKGRWSTLGLAGGTWSVRIEKEGFQPSEGALPVTEFGPAPPVTITINRIDQAVVAAAEEQAEQASVGGQAKAALDLGNQLLTQAQAGAEATKKQKYGEAKAAYEEGLTKLAAIEAKEPEQVAAIAATRLSVLQTLAGIDYELGDNNTAITRLQQVLTEKPGDAGVIQLLADILLQAGREEDAKKVMAQMPAGAKLDASTVLNMGIKAYNANQMDKALQSFEQVVRDYPDRADAHYYRGLVLLNKGKMKEAKADFEKALQLEPDGKFAADAKAFLKDIK